MYKYVWNLEMYVYLNIIENNKLIREPGSNVYKYVWNLEMYVYINSESNT